MPTKLEMRCWRCNKKLAEVIQRFDVCGIIELKREIEMQELVKELEDLTNQGLYPYSKHYLFDIKNA